MFQNLKLISQTKPCFTLVLRQVRNIPHEYSWEWDRFGNLEMECEWCGLISALGNLVSELGNLECSLVSKTSSKFSSCRERGSNFGIWFISESVIRFGNVIYFLELDLFSRMWLCGGNAVLKRGSMWHVEMNSFMHFRATVD